ncbi:MAG: FkbM family methyltransferase, partial [Isosphaeraceae bacterium]
GTIEGVRLTTLDAFVDEQRLNRLDILILDVEGFEARALRGAGATLTRFRPLLLIELFPPVLAEQGATPESVAACLEPFGYRLFAAERDRLEPLHALPHGDQGLNVFAIPSEA